MFLTVNKNVIILYENDNVVRQINHENVIEATSLNAESKIRLEFENEEDFILDWNTMKVINQFTYDSSITTSPQWGDLIERSQKTFIDWKSFIESFVEEYTIQSDGSIVTDIVGDETFYNNFQGHFSLLSSFYFGGTSTQLEITETEEGQWLDVPIEIDPAGVFDYRPQEMRTLNVDGCIDGPDTIANDSLGNPIPSKIFLLEGLSQNSVGIFRASLTFDPDEDGGQLEGRLLFSRHSGTIPSEDFVIADTILEVTQGAETIYPSDRLITFFVGDSIDTNGPGDAGQFRFQVKSTVPGDLKVLAFSLYIQK